MANIQITCINKNPRDNSHDGITHLGGANWRLTRNEVIFLIESKTNTYYTLVKDQRAEVLVVNGAYGKYLRTYADNQWNDNLLALPECR